MAGMQIDENPYHIHTLSAESQKGAIIIQRCSVENQKGAIATYFVQQQRPSGSQQNIIL